MEEVLNYFSNNVRLVSLTKPTDDDLETPEELVAYCARVSNPSNQLNNETASKLLDYCRRHDPVSYTHLTLPTT